MPLNVSANSSVHFMDLKFRGRRFKHEFRWVPVVRNFEPKFSEIFRRSAVELNVFYSDTGNIIITYSLKTQ